ncbi:MAG: intermembrane phospholipid transport protein YdbH family protein [Marinobacter sp.]
MTIRRRLKVLAVCVLLSGLLVWGGWQWVRMQLSQMGVERLEVSGIDLGWNRLAFDSVSLAWTGNGRSVLLETLEPALTMDWSSWQLDRLVARSARVVQALPAHAGSTSPSPALQLTLPDSMPFWLPRHLSVNELDAVFPCQGSQCHMQGTLRFDREADSANLQVDTTLSRDRQELAVKGAVRLGAGATGGELTVRGLRPWLVQAGGAQWQRLVPRAATLRFSPSAEPAEAGQWPMHLTLGTEGGASAAFEGQVVLDTTDPWRLDIQRGRLTGHLEQWRQSGWLLDGLRLDLPLRGSLSGAGARLTLLEDAGLRVRHADPLAAGELMWLDEVSVSAEDLSVIVGEDGLQADGPFRLDAGEIRHPALVTQAWRADGELQWAGELALTAEAASAAGTRLPLRVGYHPDDGLQAGGSMSLTPENQANQLAKTLAAWPRSLTLASGQGDLTGQLWWPPGGGPRAEATLTLQDLSGLYERMAWQGLSGEMAASLDKGEVRLSTGDLELEQLNPGLPIGPVSLSAGYRGVMDDPLAGRLALNGAEAGFAGGTFNVAGQGWQLDQAPWRVPVTLRDLELSALMELYPTEGLAGDGVLHGKLPLTIGPRGVRIERGQVSGAPPGGRLQLPADKLQAMAGNNEVMGLVTRAMEDFRYRHLESDVSYSEDGTLVLDLQLRGSSPKVDSERPIVLNINLQEDIPALLTSLQLSGRVNEAVTERVRERLQREGAD